MLSAYLRRSSERCWKIYGRYYDEGYKGHDARYREAIVRRLKPGMRLLDAGCGSEMGFTREFFPRVDMAVGLDIEPVKTVPPSTDAVRGNLGRLPFKNGCFDIIISKSVLEHLLDPDAVFHEFARVLKPNGVVVLLTPNQYDYISLIAKVTPFSFHRWILSKLLDRNEGDTFPTYYRANTKKELRSLLSRSEFIPLDITLFNQYPAYLMFSPILFRLGVFYERLTSRYSFLADLRGWIMIVAVKSGRPLTTVHVVANANDRVHTPVYSQPNAG